jgi:hypothetical protein
MSEPDASKSPNAGKAFTLAWAGTLAELVVAGHSDARHFRKLGLSTSSARAVASNYRVGPTPRLHPTTLQAAAIALRAQFAAPPIASATALRRPDKAPCPVSSAGSPRLGTPISYLEPQSRALCRKLTIFCQERGENRYFLRFAEQSQLPLSVELEDSASATKEVHCLPKIERKTYC